MPPTIKEVREINIFAVVLVVQSLPFIAAVGLAVIERTRLNDFAYWRALEARVRRTAAAARRRDRHVPAATPAAGAASRANWCSTPPLTPPARSPPASPNTTSRTGSRRR